MLFSNPDGEQVKMSREAFANAVKENRGGVKTLLRLCLRMALAEAACLAGWCLLYGVAAIYRLNRGEMFHELR